MRNLSSAAKQKIAIMLKEKQNANPFKQPPVTSPPSSLALTPKLASSPLAPMVQPSITKFPVIKAKMFSDGGEVPSPNKTPFEKAADLVKLPSKGEADESTDEHPYQVPSGHIDTEEAAERGEEMTAKNPPKPLPKDKTSDDGYPDYHNGGIVNYDEGGEVEDDNDVYSDKDSNGSSLGSIIGYPGSTKKPVKKANGGIIPDSDDANSYYSENPEAEKAAQGLVQLAKSIVDSGPKTQDSIEPDYTSPVDLLAGGVGSKLGSVLTGASSMPVKNQIMKEIMDPQDLALALGQKSQQPQNKNKGGMIFASEGYVPGKAKVKGNSIKNDVVPALLSPGELVIDRERLQNPKKAFSFLKSKLKQK